MNLLGSDLLSIRNSVERVGRLSDSLVKLGPLSLGVDGILSWIPGDGEIYSAAAAGFIQVQAARARVPVHVWLGCAALLAGRTAITAVPLLGPAAADLFIAHKWSAQMVIRAIDRKLELTPPAAEFASPYGRAAAGRG